MHTAALFALFMVAGNQLNKEQAQTRTFVFGGVFFTGEHGFVEAVAVIFNADREAIAVIGGQADLRSTGLSAVGD